MLYRLTGFVLLGFKIAVFLTQNNVSLMGCCFVYINKLFKKSWLIKCWVEEGDGIEVVADPPIAYVHILNPFPLEKHVNNKNTEKSNCLAFCCIC